jgi:hypothetical protein
MVIEPIGQGVTVCIGGLVMLFASDLITNKNYKALNKGKGDGFMILGATLYGFSKYLCVLKKNTITG